MYASPYCTSANILTLPADVLACIITSLNNGPIPARARNISGYLYPGYVGGRELEYYEVSRDCMVFKECVCAYLRNDSMLRHSIHGRLFELNEPNRELWDPEDAMLEIRITDPDDWELLHECYQQNDYDIDRERFIPRHVFAGTPKRWMDLLCGGPQTRKEYDEMEAGKRA